jgi:hypothetical protein
MDLSTWDSDALSFELAARMVTEQLLKHAVILSLS